MQREVRFMVCGVTKKGQTEWVNCSTRDEQIKKANKIIKASNVIAIRTMSTC